MSKIKILSDNIDADSGTIELNALYFAHTHAKQREIERERETERQMNKISTESVSE